MATRNTESLTVALHPRSARDRRATARPTEDLSARVDQLARDLRIQLVRIAQLQVEVDVLRKKVG